MKRKLWIMMALLLTALSIAAPIHAHAATDGCTSESGHNWQHFNFADCTSGGADYYQCTNCYAIRDSVDVPALGHSWSDWSTRMEPTCTESGTRYRQCNRCGAGETESIPARGHTPMRISGTAATCTSGGSTEGSQCSVCGAVLTAQTDTPALGHSWDGGTVTTQPSCTAEGVRTYSCTRCGETRTEAIGKTGHSPTAIPAVAATCTSGGRTEGSQCSVCGTILTAQSDTPALGHSWDGGTVTTQPNCTAEGVRTYSCTRCGETRTEAIGKTGHSPTAIPGTAATCTSGGRTEGSQCSVCGTILTAQSDTSALGHNWDEGIVTVPAGYLDTGVKTFTCRRCGAKKTEEIPLLTTHNWGSALDYFRNIGQDADAADISLFNNDIPLIVVTQPQGGAIPSGGSYTLTTEVIGGTPPYTYEWHREPKLNAAESALTSLAQGKASQIASSYSSRRSSFASGFKKTRTGSSEAAGAGKSTYSYGTAMYTQALDTPVLNLSDRNLGTSDSPDYPATAQGTYYCVIRDSAGQRVDTDRAEVVRGIYILIPPNNANLYEKESVTLTCTAAGGTPFGEDYESAYSYYWYDSQGNSVGYGQQIEVSQEGEYYCVAEDAGMERVTSEMCTVYSRQPHTITLLRSVYAAENPENVKVNVNFAVTGGTAPFTCDWYKGTELQKSISTDADVVNVIEVYETGTYRLNVFDATGELRTASCRVVDEVQDLTILDAGAYGSAEEQQWTVHIEVSGGLPPYYYRLYHEEELRDQSLADSTNESYSVTKPGVYHFLVEDKQGNSAESGLIRISADGKPTIIQQPESVELDPREDGQYSARLTCKAISAMGDEKKVWYEWQRKSDKLRAWRANLGNADFYPVSEPGTYRCKVTDTETGIYVYSDIVKVGVRLEVENLAIDVTKEGYYLTGDIVGGVAPYTLVIHTLRIVDQAPNENNTYDDVFLDSASAPLTYDSATSFREYLTNKITYEFYVKSKGSYIPQSSSFIYYVVLTDSIGTVYESVSENGIALSSK